MPVYELYQQLERFIGWTDEDARRMELLGPMLSPYFDDLVDDFYAEIQRHPRAAQVLTAGTAQIDRLKQTLRGWLSELFSGQYDSEYVARRWNVGKRHVDIGLDQLYTNASLSRLRRGLLEALSKAWTGPPAQLRDCRDSLNALLDLNRAIIENAYHTEYERRQSTAERLAMIGKVAGSLVEELRGPLDAAKDSIRSLQQARDMPPDIQTLFLDSLNRHAGLAEAVISALNEYVRLPLESFQPVEIVECLKNAMDRDALPEGADVQWDLPVAKLFVLGDPAQLRIVLINVIRHAQDTMSKKGLLRLSAVPDGDGVYITVQHSKRCKCSGTCARSHQRSTHGAPPVPKKPGLGLGLSILNDIVLRHHGVLTISEEHAGSTALLRLPARRAPLVFADGL